MRNAQRFDRNAKNLGDKVKTKSVFMGTTKIDPQKTIGEISSCLVSAGAKQIATDFATAGRIEAVRFSIDVPGIQQPVFFRLPCRTEKLLKLLRGDRAQAERTAWRQVLRWVESQMAMIEVGMVQTHEVFQPYAIIPGTEKTMFQAWEASMPLQIEAGK